MLDVLAPSSAIAPPYSPLIHCIPYKFLKICTPFYSFQPIFPLLVKKQSISSNLFIPHSHESSTFNFTEDPSFTSDNHWDFSNEGFEEDDDENCPWEGAVMYKRNAAVSHLEYCTTLERLGLGKVSSAVSKSRASEMGLRVVESVKDCPNGTPVLISVDVTKKKQKLRLDGIVRTVIALRCNSRCGEPAAQSVYSNFTILLCEEAIQEQDSINMGIIFAEEKSRPFGSNKEDDHDDDSLIDLDDQLYFPPDEKAIDISKNIRDLIHVEITMNALCDPTCKGMCLKCGINLNVSNCTCKMQTVKEKAGYGPLGDLRNKMKNV